MKTHTLEGTWTGYTPAQRHVVHREHTLSPGRVEEIRGLGSIAYTDGTRLILTVTEGKHGKAIRGYGRLIAQCLRHNVSSVADLPARTA